MKKTLIALSILGSISFTYAEYTIKVPLESSKGGSLPNNSIVIKNQISPEIWEPTDPFFTEWVNSGNLTGCSNWSPDPSTVALGETFTQERNCDQEKTRTVQQREQETTTLSIRNVGDLITENQLVTVTESREIEGTYGPWDAFADENGLEKNWANLNWTNKNSKPIPIQPYPLKNINNIYFGYNQLTNVDGLSNLSRISGTLYLRNNQLTNVDGLSDLTSVITLELRNNQLTNIDGLSNVVVSYRIHIDSSYSGQKLTALTKFCSLNDASIFYGASKNKLCETP